MASLDCAPARLLVPPHTDGVQTPEPLAFELPPHLAERAVDGLSWLSVIGSVMSVLIICIYGGLQPEVARAWAHPLLYAAMAGIVLMSVGFAIAVRSGRIGKRRLLDLGACFQVCFAFAGALLESATHRDPSALILGNSGIAVWMMLCGRLMPMAPMKSAITGALCAAAWPLAYWLNVRMLGFTPMPGQRLLVRALPLMIVAGWVYVLNGRVLRLYISQQRAEDAGSYSLTRMIGAGGMGEVWEARHRTLARGAAVKLIRRQLLLACTGQQEESMRKRFEREAQVTASLRSPHTVALFDYGQTRDGGFYYAMELLQGIDLQEMVDRYGPIEPARVAHILIQICHSLEEAHRAGLVHRDIKPRNVMINRLGIECDVVKVLDFGLVKQIHEASREAALQTAEGMAAGTPAYLSPEAVTGEHAVDARSDLYSLGCTAYFLLTGRTVFEASTPVGYALAHVQRKPPRMIDRSELPVPEDLEAIVMQLLEKTPAGRIQSARELARRLQTLDCFGKWTGEKAERWWDLHRPRAAASDGVVNDDFTATATALSTGRHTV